MPSYGGKQGAKGTSPVRHENFDNTGFQQKMSYMNASSHSYNPSYDPARYQQ